MPISYTAQCDLTGSSPLYATRPGWLLRPHLILVSPTLLIEMGNETSIDSFNDLVILRSVL